MPTLDFKGKPFVYSHHLSVPFRELVVDASKSVPPAGEAPGLDGNLIIHGDNLEALKALLPRYAGKVDVIYIDPPYNTGNEGWAYNDNVNAPQLKAWLGKTVDADDMERHDKWLCMMWPRLQLLRELLSETGVILVSMDETEISLLYSAMDEIFGSDNRFENIIWKKRYGGGPKEKFFVNLHEYVLVYAKSKSVITKIDRPLTPEKIERYYKWTDDTQTGSAELRSILGPDAFPYPKPSSLLSTILEAKFHPTDNANVLVLDSFAGSGTTAHAVLALNKADGGNRKFILVETEDYADALTAERVRRVIKGVPGAKDAALKDGLGGSFTFCELGEPMDMERFFAEDGKAPSWDQVARYVAYTATGETLTRAEGEDGFAGHAGPYRLHLLYRDDPKWMRSNDAMLDLTTAERIAAAAQADGGKPVLVFAAGKLMGQRALTDLGITFCQLPYSVHRILGDGSEGVAGVDAA
ncbi:site-specific DNA-methyltransferase [Sphingopyxis sp. LC363]|uniref:site-specific DNA-methyltransferase n=1 Tax=Sphingopyxis sp. LC363 TaxID=1120705 RepID=UPI00050DBDD2|nr:site-specific DNA-methyltransferase [Sphingopyxis sp. LC363]KGB58906.1 DNA methylase N-4/N-6 [Sphingopyxis sp. LC363]